MINEFHKNPNQFKNPFSLIWKWGFLLSAIIWLAIITVPMVIFSFNQKDIQTEFDQSRAVMDKQLPQLMAELPNLSEDAILDFVNQPANLLENKDSIERTLNNRDVLVQIHDVEGQLLYSSGSTFLPLRLDQDFGSWRIEESGNQHTYAPIKNGEDITGYYYAVHNRNDEVNLLKENRNEYVYFVVIALLISGLLGFAISYWLQRPVRQIQMILQRITGDNISDTRLSISNDNSNDEIADISIGINQLLDRMSAYIEQQIGFVEDVSHELRTPVAIVEGHLRLLNRWGKNDPELLDESLGASINEMQRMKILIQEMLDLTRAGQVDIQYYDSEVVVNDVIDTVYQNFTMLYEDFHFYLENDLRIDYKIQMYRNHLEQILVILMDNAVKYSTDRKEIHLSVATDNVGYIEIAIQDFGEGMSREDQDKVFNRFYRVDKARSREKGGNGLGLSIAKELVEGYRGNISVESSLGYGTIFHIRLPILEDNKSE